LREIVLDTETTGLSTEEDRVIEIGCVELVDLFPTGRTFHVYVNPQKKVTAGAFKVHGLGNEFLTSKPTFKRVAERFLKFIGDATLVAHNADFDIRMLNAELARMEEPPLNNSVVDTLVLAKEVKKGGKHTLDALCSHFKIDTSRRVKHGALLDAEILADLYIELRGGRQIRMDMASPADNDNEEVIVCASRHRPQPLPSRLTHDDRLAHQRFVVSLGLEAVWNEYLPPWAA
jgi:DNA polymerase-3 subunit epsilon